VLTLASRKMESKQMDEGPEWPPLPRGGSEDSASNGNETASFKCWESVRVCIPAIVYA